MDAYKPFSSMNISKKQRSVRNVAMDLLARREHSRLELSRKLLKCDCLVEEVEAVLAQLIAEGLLSDERFAEAYVKMRSNRGFGPLRISQELAERGIDDALIQAMLQMEEIDWQQLAIQVYTKKYADSEIEDFSQRSKRANFLAYRGFTQEQINAALTM